MPVYQELAVNISPQASKAEKLSELHSGCLHLTKSILDLPLEGEPFQGSSGVTLYGS